MESGRNHRRPQYPDPYSQWTRHVSPGGHRSKIRPGERIDRIRNRGWRYGENLAPQRVAENIAVNPESAEFPLEGQPVFRCVEFFRIQLGDFFKIVQRLEVSI